MVVKDVGEAAVAAGWRKKAADALAPRVAESPLPLRERDARVAIGLVLLALSVKYVAATISRVRRDASART